MSDTETGYVDLVGAIYLLWFGVSKQDPSACVPTHLFSPLQIKLTSQPGEQVNTYAGSASGLYPLLYAMISG